jgi:hypothetical protein
MHFLRAPFNIKWFLVKSQLFKNKYLGRTKIEIPSGKTEKKTSNSTFFRVSSDLQGVPEITYQKEDLLSSPYFSQLS